MTQIDGRPNCFKPSLSHLGEEREAEVFLRNKKGTLVPLCEPCYAQFMETYNAIDKKEIWKDYQDWFDKSESERRVSLEAGMAEFLEQERARKDGSREGPSMMGPRSTTIPVPDPAPMTE